MARPIKAPRGSQLTCKNWLIEAPYRMLQNNLDPQVAGDPEHLIVYGGRGKAARNWTCLGRFWPHSAIWSRMKRYWFNRANRWPCLPPTRMRRGS